MKNLIKKAIEAIDNNKLDYAKGILETVMELTPDKVEPMREPIRDTLPEMKLTQHESVISDIAKQGLHVE